MRYGISFTTGELAGKSFMLSQDRLLSIGRSNTSDVKLSSPEISGKHVTVRLSKANVAVIEVFSTHLTLHNGKKLSMGDSVEMAANDTVQLGAADSFMLVSLPGDAAPAEDDMRTTMRPFAPVPPPANNDELSTRAINFVPPRQQKAAPASSDEQSTRNDIKPQPIPPQRPAAPPKPAPAKPAPAKPAPAKQAPKTEQPKAEPQKSTGGETVAIQTLLASDEELDKIKSSFLSKQRRKTGMWVILVAFFLALSISVYIILRPEKEEQLSWPTTASGQFLNEYSKLDDYLAICYPQLPNNVKNEITNGLEIFTAIGKQRDVPMHIVATKTIDKETLTKSREEAFQAWMKQQKEADTSIVFSTLQEFIFTCQDSGSGVPFNRVAYTRRVENEDYYGYAVYLRYEDAIHTILIEVPLAAQWRSTAYFMNYLESMVIFAGKRAPEYWEGTSDYKKNSTIEEDFNEVKIYQKRKSPVYWEKIHYSLISALIKAKQKGDEASLNRAKSLLETLRSEQSEWYSTQKLAYQLAFKNENKATMQSIQAMASSIFTPEFQQSDYRYELIKRKDWK